MSAQAPGRGGGKGGRGSGRGTSQRGRARVSAGASRGSTIKARFFIHSIGERLHSLEEEQHAGQERPPVKKAKWGRRKVEEKSHYKHLSLRTLGVETEFLIVDPENVDREHLF